MGMIYAQEADDSELTTFEEEALSTALADNSVVLVFYILPASVCVCLLLPVVVFVWLNFLSFPLAMNSQELLVDVKHTYRIGDFLVSISM